MVAEPAGARAALSGAVFSEDGVYRYRLWRRWGDWPAMNVIMLNPSTADASVNDPTVRRCVSFAARHGYGGLVVTNLFALRSTDPRRLRDVADPVGPENDLAIVEEAERAGCIVAAWGVHGELHLRAYEVAGMLAGRTVWCLGMTRERHPRHPLYVRGVTELVVYR